MQEVVHYSMSLRSVRKNFSLDEDHKSEHDQDEYPVKLKTFSSKRVHTPPSSPPSSSKSKQNQEEVILRVTSFTSKVCAWLVVSHYIYHFIITCTYTLQLLIIVWEGRRGTMFITSQFSPGFEPALKMNTNFLILIK